LSEPVHFVPERLPHDALRDRVVLVCGAAGGLGAAVARAAGAAGATVVLLGRRVKALEKVYDEIRALGAPEPALYPLDLEGAGGEDYLQLAESIARECGRLDGIVHAAARFEGLTALEHCDPLDWLRGIHVNLAAPALLTRACLPLLRQSRHASVVFLLDDPARSERANWGAYGVAKAALRGLVTSLGDELENSNVRVLGLNPGPMRTALRAKAYFAENPAAIAGPEYAALACVALLAHADARLNGHALDLADAQPAATEAPT
jgi:NAD(P)-dependent dehydrogenase (short-subunit alcohol dehydrogenase family)